MSMIIKCKMCGGDIEFTPGVTYGTCEYCGSTSTIPKAEDETKLNRYNRANHFRRQCEFDKALAAYEKLLEQDDTDAEAHWGAVISRYGIEYVEDPATGRRVPTCHRVQVASILADADYLAALENAPDAESRRLYEAQAAEIAEIQKGILAISANEKPYDVFICYKETDENGQRTRDSQWAQEVYYGLTEQGYKVFFSRITLEDKLGQQYEPYIFAALNSARVMVVIGSRPEHFGAVWVKNEWSRYLALMAKDRKRLLIPCYRGMDPYDLPEELSALQSQDMSKIGFMQDLLRGIRKVLDAEKKPEQPQVIVQQAAPVAAPAADANLTALLKRGDMALADGEWRNADEFFEKALNLDAEAAEAYMGKFLVREQSPGIEAWADRCCKALEGGVQPQTLNVKQTDGETAHIEQTVGRLEVEQYLSAEKIWSLYQVKRTYSSTAASWEKARQSAEQKLKDKNLVRALQFAAGALKERYEAAVGDLTGKLDAQLAAARRRDEASIRQIRAAAAETFAKADIQAEALHRAAAAQLAQDMEDKYVEACLRMETAQQNGSMSDYDAAAARFEELKVYKDSREKAAACRLAAEQLREAERIAKQQREEAERRRAAEAKAKKRRTLLAAAALAIIAAAAFFVVTRVIIPGNRYKEAEALLAAGQYQQASEAFAQAGEYKDAAERVLEPYYAQAEALLAERQYQQASEAFTQAGSYKDAAERVGEPYYVQAETFLAAGQYQQASEAFAQAGSYKDAAERVGEPYYKQAKTLLAAGQYQQASEAFAQAGSYKDAAGRVLEPYYVQAEVLLAAGEYDAASEAFVKADGYKDAAERVGEPYYVQAEALLAEGKTQEATAAFMKAGDYSDSTIRIKAAYYAEGEEKRNLGDWTGAMESFLEADDYGDAKEQLAETRYQYGKILANDVGEEGAVQIITARTYYREVDRDSNTYYKQSLILSDDCNLRAFSTLYSRTSKFEGGRITGSRPFDTKSRGTIKWIEPFVHCIVNNCYDIVLTEKEAIVTVISGEDPHHFEGTFRIP